MAILSECPGCRRRCSTKAKKCACGLNIGKTAYKVYWIDYRFDGRRIRERIGPSKSAAENRLREVKTQIAEGRYIQRHHGANRFTLGALCAWYLALPEVIEKKSYIRDKQYIQHLLRILGANLRVADLNEGMVDSYIKTRQREPSATYKGQLVKPATINKEVGCFATILNRAVRHKLIVENPLHGIRKLPEHNERTRILLDDEFERLLKACPEYLKGIVLMAYYLPMRQAEVLTLTWEKVDMVKGFIRLNAEDTKTGVARSVRLHPRVLNMLRSLPRGLHTDRVFLKAGQPVSDIHSDYVAAVKRADIENFTFHDLRHCAINNLRLAGNDYFKIMAMSGHKTTKVFKRYNLVTEEELAGVKWKAKSRLMDTSEDTSNED